MSEVQQYKGGYCACRTVGKLDVEVLITTFSGWKVISRQPWQFIHTIHFAAASFLGHMGEKMHAFCDCPPTQHAGEEPCSCFFVSDKPLC